MTHEALLLINYFTKLYLLVNFWAKRRAGEELSVGCERESDNMGDTIPFDRSDLLIPSRSADRVV